MMENFQAGGELIPDIDAAARLVYSGKRILIAGAAGSIGTQLILQLLRFAPYSIAALDKDENALSDLERTLDLRRGIVPVEPYVADIRDAGRLGSICQSFAPQVIFHVAGYKDVALMELHPSEAVLANVMGTKNLLDVIAGFGAERFVYVSSEMAVNPVSVMGATKRIGEMLVQVAAQSGRVQGASVRFGDILGSRGSVVRMFQRQIDEGGPVTVTHPDVVRCFMTMHQAVHLILVAGCEAQKGEIFVADFGRPRNIHDLAREMILLAGLEPEKDIVIRMAGLRPGERLVEELFSASEKVVKTRFKGLSAIDSPLVSYRTLMHNIGNLVQYARSVEPRGIRSVLSVMGLGYKHTPEPRSLKTLAASAVAGGEPVDTPTPPTKMPSAGEGETE
jgi:FlaA1/EpsC-like NDP-sugar epimerase